MSKMHILASDGNRYDVIVHFAMPTGNNSASKTWKSVALASGATGTTSRTVGTNPGQITQVEYDAILAGDTAEIQIQVNDNATADEANAIADAAIAAWKADMQRKLKWYGLQLG